MKIKNPLTGSKRADGTENSFLDTLKVALSPKEINIYLYVRHLESVVARWMILAAVQTAALIYLAVIGGSR